jgi:acyl-CoA synthetase (AMP-forming)/AMP-acid ligase II
MTEDAPIMPQGDFPGRDFTHGSSIAPAFPTVTAAILHHILTIPDEVAAIDHSARGPRSVTYAELGRRSIQLTRRLQNGGLRPGDRVPLVAKRGIEMIIGIVSILCCGAQYVPVDGKVVAKETLRRVIEQATGDMVLCLESTRRRVEDLALSGCKVVSIGDPVGEAPNMDICAFVEESLKLVTPKSGCYVIYTSGISPLHYPIHLRILLYG